MASRTQSGAKAKAAICALVVVVVDSVVDSVVAELDELEETDSVSELVTELNFAASASFMDQVLPPAVH